MLSKNKYEHAAPLFKQLGILPLDEMIKLKRASFMWKLNNNILPKTTEMWFKKNNSIIMNRLHFSKYCLPNPRTEYAKRHNIYSAIKLWNTEIPNNFKTSTNLKICKIKYRNILLYALK